MEEKRAKRMALIASKGTLDWAYPPFILASTAVAMEMEVAVFFLLRSDIAEEKDNRQGSSASEPRHAH